MCVHLREHCACKQFFFSNPFSDFPKKRKERESKDTFLNVEICFSDCALIDCRSKFWISKFNPYFPVIQQCTFPCQQIMLDCMDTVEFISILNLKILHFLLFRRQINQEIQYTLKLNRLYWKDSWNVVKQKGAFKSNTNHKKLEFQSSGPSKTVISRNRGEIEKNL